MGRHGEPEHGPRGPAVLDVATHVNVETVERSTQQQQHQHHNHNSKGPADDHFRIFNLSLVPNSKFVFINRNLIFQFTFRHSAFLCTISAPPTNVTRPLPRHDDDFFCLISSLRRSAFVRLMKLSLFHLNDFFVEALPIPGNGHGCRIALQEIGVPISAPKTFFVVLFQCGVSIRRRSEAIIANASSSTSS